MAQPSDIRTRIREAIHHFEHVLPGQAPIKDFVHHNTLHGFQHMKFPKALTEAKRITGANGYLPLQTFRDYLRQGRITREELAAVLERDRELNAQEALFEGPDGPVTRGDIYLAGLIHPLKPMTGCQLNWQIEEQNALQAFQADVAPESRQRLLKTAGTTEPASMEALWNACLETLDLDYYLQHPEELLDLSPDQAKEMLEELIPSEGAESDQSGVQQQMVKEGCENVYSLLDRVGRDLTLRGLLQLVTGKDLLQDLRPYLLRHLGNFLDQGMASWHHKDRAEGFYISWLRSVGNNLTWVFEDLGDWSYHLDSLPKEPLEAIVEELWRLDLPQERWIGYLERLALELPGWSGMFLWRHLNPGYANQSQPVGMLDYLAVRLVMERMFAHRLCAEQWNIEPALDTLRWYFRHHPAELLVRHALFAERLPEYLASRAQRLILRREESIQEEAETETEAEQWQHLAQLIWTWQQSPAADRGTGYSVYRNAWPLFRLAQHLGLCAETIRSVSAAEIKGVFDCLGRLDEETACFIWLRAYENHYRDQIFNALLHNHGRGRWAGRSQRPAAQLVFCMDDREEAVRRHLEELNPRIETLGAAAHFGVPHWWRGLDDSEPTGLTPVVIVPSNEIRELLQPGNERRKAEHDRRRGWRNKVRDLLHHEIRRNLLSSSAAIAVSAPLALATLAGKVLAPLQFGQRAEALRRRFDLEVPTRIEFTADRYDGAPSPDNVQPGFTTEEQAQRVGNFLRTIGLADGFARLVVILGHGSDSQNNPHIAAYNCGACSGNHSGPNARIFAAMANRPEVRALLRERHIEIPDDCWFLGAEHNTCDERVEWYDLELVPGELRPDLDQLLREVASSCIDSAHERSRKFASAPRGLSREQAHRHIVGRGYDFSQARPELGHATNACAVIGRRSVSQGAFFDRRMFLISYDPTKDPDGTLLEPLLLANGPVGAGINLEYYFSTVDNQGYGSGTKITHNVSGFLGVMEGAGSDLRTGLPKQMIEIHEAMRLQVIVEAKTEVLTEIYMRQPPLQELIGNGWLLLSAIDPDSGVIDVFDPERGWERWKGAVSPLPTFKNSSDYYPGTLEPLTPVLIEQKAVNG